MCIEIYVSGGKNLWKMTFWLLLRACLRLNRHAGYRPRAPVWELLGQPLFEGTVTISCCKVKTTKKNRCKTIHKTTTKLQKKRPQTYLFLRQKHCVNFRAYSVCVFVSFSITIPHPILSSLSLWGTRCHPHEHQLLLLLCSYFPSICLLSPALPSVYEHCVTELLRTSCSWLWKLYIYTVYMTFQLCSLLHYCQYELFQLQAYMTYDRYTWLVPGTDKPAIGHIMDLVR